MFWKITVWKAPGEIFFVNSLKDILTLRNNFRIQGLMIQKQFFDVGNCLFLILNWEETLLGIEGNFLKIKHVQSFFRLYLKKSIFRFFNKNKYFGKPSMKFFIKKKNHTLIRQWRENKSLFFKTFLILIKFKRGRSDNYFKMLTKDFFSSRSNRYLFLEKKTSFGHLKLKDYSRYFIYRDLWLRGFTVSCGLKFGASFLVYATNVGLVHSFLSIFISSYPIISFSASLISFGRLGTVTRKSTLLAFVAYNGFSNYLGLKWHKDLP